MTMRLRELTIRYSASRDADGQPVLIGRTVERAADAASALLSLLQDEAAEVFVILYLSTKRRVIGFHRVSRGTLDSTPVHPREVFKVALLANAGSISRTPAGSASGRCTWSTARRCGRGWRSSSSWAASPARLSTGRRSPAWPSRVVVGSGEAAASGHAWSGYCVRRHR